jgi:hypothetical protein
MEALIDPHHDRVMRKLTPPPHKPISQCMLYPDNSKYCEKGSVENGGLWSFLMRNSIKLRSPNSSLINPCYHGILVWDDSNLNFRVNRPEFQCPKGSSSPGGEGFASTCA